MACFHSQQLILWATSWLKKNLLLTKVRWLIDITLTAECLVMTMMDQWRWNIFFSSRHNIDTSSFQQQACQATNLVSPLCNQRKMCKDIQEYDMLFISAPCCQTVSYVNPTQYTLTVLSQEFVTWSWHLSLSWHFCSHKTLHWQYWNVNITVHYPL